MLIRVGCTSSLPWTLPQPRQSLAQAKARQWLPTPQGQVWAQSLPPALEYPSADPLGGPGHGCRVWSRDAEAGGWGMLGLPTWALHDPGVRVRVVLQRIPLTPQQLHLGDSGKELMQAQGQGPEKGQRPRWGRGWDRTRWGTGVGAGAGIRAGDPGVGTVRDQRQGTAGTGLGLGRSGAGAGWKWGGEGQPWGLQGAWMG